MGCGESKHDVVTGNTVLQRKQSDDNSAKNSARDIETVHEKPTAAADKLSQSGIKDDSAVVDAAANVKKEADDENKTKLRDDDNEKGILDDHKREDDVVEAKIGQDSPNHFFSSRKDEELGIDGIISEGRSSKSEYNTPRHGAGINKDDSVLGPNNDDNQDHQAIVEENNKDSLAHADQKITQAEKENEKAVNVKENLVKEEVETTKVEEKDSKPAEEEKSSTQKDEEKHVVA